MGGHWAKTGYMSGEHSRVSEALIQFRVKQSYEQIADDRTEFCFFTPTRLLYTAYLGWFKDNMPEDATPIGEVAFGRSLRHALGVEKYLRFRRMYKGRMEWGYLGVKGPGSITIPNKKGRRLGSKNVPKTPAPAAEVQARAEAAPGDSDTAPLPAPAEL